MNAIGLPPELDVKYSRAAVMRDIDCRGSLVADDVSD
jgi:hypothetical protein